MYNVKKYIYVCVTFVCINKKIFTLYKTMSEIIDLWSGSWILRLRSRIFFGVGFLFFLLTLLFILWITIPIIIIAMIVFLLKYLMSCILLQTNNSFTINTSLLSSSTDNLEAILLTQYTKLSYPKSTWSYLPKHAMQIHSVIIPGRSPNKQRSMLCIHGSSSSAVATWASCIDDMALMASEVHLVDLPGFGRTPNPLNVNGGGLDGKATTKILVDILGDYMMRYELEDCIVVGHSFGGYLAVELAYQNANLINTVILVSPVGLFPCLGELGAWWGIVFKSSFPTSMIHAIQPFGQFILKFLLMTLPLSDLQLTKAFYEIQYLKSSPRCSSPVSKHISLNMTSVAWKEPNFQKLINLSVRVAMIFGEKDTIIPPHIGVEVNAITDIPCHTIPLAWHRPSIEQPTIFVDFLKVAIDNATIPNKTLVDILDFICWQTPYDARLAREMILHQFYPHLKKIVLSSQ